MCGIIGIIGGEDNAREQVVDGLKKLEYRGYDSWGVAIGGKKINIEKNIGKISAVNSKSESESYLAIGHTRWATHGGVTTANAHPHTDCTGQIAVVHNGIIENYQELKKELEKKGHFFKSQTDTEVIPHLVEEELKSEKDFKTAFMKALAQLKGSYAIALIQAEANEIWVAANGCPLVLGQTTGGETIISSDILACNAKNVAFVPAGAMLCLGKKKLNLGT